MGESSQGATLWPLPILVKRTEAHYGIAETSDRATSLPTPLSIQPNFLDAPLRSRPPLDASVPPTLFARCTCRSIAVFIFCIASRCSGERFCIWRSHSWRSSSGVEAITCPPSARIVEPAAFSCEVDCYWRTDLSTKGSCQSNPSEETTPRTVLSGLR